MKIFLKLLKFKIKKYWLLWYLSILRKKEWVIFSLKELNFRILISFEDLNCGIEWWPEWRPDVEVLPISPFARKLSLIL